MTSSFFKFIQEFDTESSYMNTYNGEVGIKNETDEDLHGTGLTVLHPYYTNITLLPFK